MGSSIRGWPAGGGPARPHQGLDRVWGAEREPTEIAEATTAVRRLEGCHCRRPRLFHAPVGISTSVLGNFIAPIEERFKYHPGAVKGLTPRARAAIFGNSHMVLGEPMHFPICRHRLTGHAHEGV